MKTGIKNFREKHPGSIIILKMVNDPLHVWKENHSMTMFRCYFRVNKGHDHILLVDDKKVTKARMTGYIKETHTTIFTSSTGCGKLTLF